MYVSIKCWSILPRPHPWYHFDVFSCSCETWKHQILPKFQHLVWSIPPTDTHSSQWIIISTDLCSLQKSPVWVRLSFVQLFKKLSLQQFSSPTLECTSCDELRCPCYCIRSATGQNTISVVSGWCGEKRLSLDQHFWWMTLWWVPHQHHWTDSISSY